MERATGAWFEEISLLASAPDKQLATPIRGIAIRRIANTWHAPRSPHRLHEGEDIFARRGTPVYSATCGIVTRIGEKGLGGNAVSILGAGGRVYYYAHLDRFAPGLRAGNEVTPDTLIGFVGNTGNARTTPPHLHFGVYTTAGAIDPLPLLLYRPINTDAPAGVMDRWSTRSASRNHSDNLTSGKVGRT
jgi:peptidoglycan LD-endopeptidase LytH